VAAFAKILSNVPDVVTPVFEVVPEAAADVSFFNESPNKEVEVSDIVERSDDDELRYSDIPLNKLSIGVRYVYDDACPPASAETAEATEEYPINDEISDTSDDDCIASVKIVAKSNVESDLPDVEETVEESVPFTLRFDILSCISCLRAATF
jgi:hypothetical protein